jgi:hypothetical protein
MYCFLDKGLDYCRLGGEINVMNEQKRFSEVKYKQLKNG